MKTKILLSLFISLPLASGLFGQCEPTGTTTLHGNKVAATIHNGGDMFWDLQANPGYIVPWTANAAAQRHSLFTGAFWMGGLDTSGTLHVATQTYRQSGQDFFPGPIRTNGNYGCDSIITYADVPLIDGLLRHSSGKILGFYTNGFGVFDPATWTVTDNTFPVNRAQYNVLELPNQKVMVACQNAVTPEPMLLVSPPSFSTATGITLNYNHSTGSIALLSNGMVLIVSAAGAEIYDPVADTSGIILPGAAPHVNSTCITLNSGILWVTGGGNSGTTNTEFFDPATRIWSPGPNLLNARTGHVLVKLATGEIVIIGGNNNTTQVELYDPNTNTVSPFGNLPVPAKTANATLLSNGKILITAYYISGGSQYNFIEFDPSTQTSSSITTQYVKQRCIGLPSGDVMVEYSGTGHRVYQPATGTWMHGRYQKVWKLTAAEITQFQSDYLNNTVNFANYPDIETWPGNGNMSLTEDPHLAPFVDVNNDGWYKPEDDGDYPCITGDEMVWYIINDVADAHVNTPGPSLGVQAEISAFAFNCNSTVCPDTALDYTTFYRIEMVNKSQDDYTDFHISFFLDADLGNYGDDYVGADSLLEVGFCYNGDANDEGATGYGTNPPAIGGMVLEDPLQSRLDGMMFYNNDFSATGNPATDAEYYNYMTNRWKDGTPLTYGGNGYGGSVNTNWFFSGDAGWCGGAASGWTEYSAGNQPFDRRLILNTGGSDFNAGDTLDVTFAIVWSRGTNGNLSSVCELLDDAQAIRTWWDAQNFGCFNLVMDKPGPKAEVKSFDLYPNPTSHSVTVSLGDAPLHNTQVQVLNAVGQQVAAATISTGHNNTIIDVSSLPAGIYFVQVLTASGPLTQRLVVQK